MNIIPIFKIEAVRLLETSGKSAAQLERELGISEGCMSRWKRQFAEEGENAFPGHGRVTPDQERIHQLERENEILCQERDILKKQWPSSRAQWVYHHLYHTHDEAKADVFFYIESFYNRRRRHSALDYLGPEAYGQLFHERERTFA